MKTRILWLLTILALLLGHGLPIGRQEARAQGIVEVRALLQARLLLQERIVLSVDGKHFIEPLSQFRLLYTVTNSLETDIQVQAVLEEVADKHNRTASRTIKVEKTLGPGESLRVDDSAHYNAELEFAPYVMRYTLFYTVGDGEEIFEVMGQTTVHVINARINASYRLLTEPPIFKGQTVRYEAQVESVSNITLYNIVVRDSVSGVIGTIPALAPGEKRTLQQGFVLTETTDSHLIVSFDDPMGMGRDYEQEMRMAQVRAEVREEASIASLEIAGEVDKGFLPAVEEVTFTLRIRNNGNTPITGIECLDPAGSVIFTQDRLEENETVVVTHRTQGQPDTTYTFRVQGIVAGSSQRIQAAVSVAIHNLDPRVEIERTLDPEIIVHGEPFVIQYLVRNIGNVALQDLVLTEPDLGEIGRHALLDPGEEVLFVRELTLEENMTSHPFLTAADRETGRGYRYDASEWVIGPEPMPERVELSILLQADEMAMRNPGVVELEAIVKNTGNTPLREIRLVLMDRDIAVDTLALLQPGEERTLSIPPLAVERTETFHLEALVQGEDSQSHTFQSNFLTVEVGRPAAGRLALLRTALIVILLLILLISGTLFYLIKGPFKFKKGGKQRSARA